MGIRCVVLNRQVALRKGYALAESSILRRFTIEQGIRNRRYPSFSMQNMAPCTGYAFADSSILAGFLIGEGIPNIRFAIFSLQNK